MKPTTDTLESAAYAALVLLLIGSACLLILPMVSAAPPPADPALAVKWSTIGPRDVWGSSGKVNAFAYVESNPAVMYLGGGWGNTPKESPSQMGIYATTDGGAHWAAANQGLTNPDGTISSVVNSMWLDQNNPSVVLASTEFGGTFKSTDSGATWTNVDRSESTRFALVGTTLYLATSKGVLQSTDDGSTWTVSLALKDGATTVVTAAGATFAGSTDGDVYQLSGSSWTKLGHPGTGAIHDLTVDPFDTKVIYASVDDSGVWNECLHASTDGGTNWTAINCNLFSIGSQAIAFSSVTPHRLFAGDDGTGCILYFKGDGNPNPSISCGASGTSDVRYVIPVKGKSKSDDACFVLSDQGLASTPTCSSGSVTYLSLPIANTLVYDVAVSPDGKDLAAPLQDNDNGSSTDGGSTWIGGPVYEGGEARWDPDNSGYCYINHPDVGLYISTNSCASFSGSSYLLESITFDPTDANTLYAVDIGSNQVAKSTDKGSSWNSAGWNLTNPYQVAVAPSDARSIVVATGATTAQNKVFYSHDGGTTWQQSSGLPEGVGVLPEDIWFPTHRFYAAFDPKDATTVLLADHDPKTNNILIYKSTDGAQSFTHIHTFVQPPTQRGWPHLLFPDKEKYSHNDAYYYATRFYANRVVFNPAAKSGDPAVVVTTRFGAFLSMDLGTTWKRIDTLAIPHQFEGAAWSQGHVYLASFGEGIIRTNQQIQP